MFNLVLRRGNDEVGGDTDALAHVGEGADVVDDGGAHVGGHLAVHEDNGKRVDEVIRERDDARAMLSRRGPDRESA